MYYPDLSPYQFLIGGDDVHLFPGHEVLNIGWLHPAHEFPRGRSPSGLLEALLLCCYNPVNQTRGFHDSWFGDEIRINAAGRERRLGSAEIRVAGGGQRVYAAPDLIYHYVKDLAYLPPREFIYAVLR